MTDAAREILGKERRIGNPSVTRDVLDLFDERRDLKKKQHEAEEIKITGKQTRGFRCQRGRQRRKGQVLSAKRLKHT